MNYLNSIAFNESNTVAGIPLKDRFSHLSVPLGLVCSERRFYDKQRNIHISETICENHEFDRLARSAQQIQTTRKKKQQAQAKKTKRRKN